jgi:hypothetical protein
MVKHRFLLVTPKTLLVNPGAVTKQNTYYKHNILLNSSLSIFFFCSFFYHEHEITKKYTERKCHKWSFIFLLFPQHHLLLTRIFFLIRQLHSNFSQIVSVQTLNFLPGGGGRRIVQSKHELS